MLLVSLLPAMAAHAQDSHFVAAVADRRCVRHGVALCKSAAARRWRGGALRFETESFAKDRTYMLEGV
ncbi:putative secreted protein [Xanthomonas albilineans GPE PC73]|uniref:Putative secreted protein n=1 Tax=Xanthomonas albilineans (strain GPE PC73 / CFBP 7063) TaxID=380358 RepID=D2UC23_XANAP|nr:putative secreted protein [Xanthomonas albilineans GPE PC73]